MRRRFRVRRQRRLTGRSRAFVIALTWLQISLLAAALRDLRRRPAERVRGPKVLWALASFANFVGPISYFLVGRRR